MVKLVLLFKQPANEDYFEQGYINNLADLEKMPGIIRQQANMVLGSPEGRSPYYRILELYFDSYEAMDRAMRSEEGIHAGQSLLAYAEENVELLFVDVLEEDYVDKN